METIKSFTLPELRRFTAIDRKELRECSESGMDITPSIHQGFVFRAGKKSVFIFDRMNNKCFAMVAKELLKYQSVYAR